MSTFDVIRMRFILDKQKFSNGFTEAKKQIKRDTGEMRRNLDRLKLAHVRAFREMRDEIPGFNAAMRLVKNPYVAAAAGVAVLYKGFQKTTQAAADFNTQFRQLQNLNIDKPINELNRLKNTVLDTAFGSGFDARKTSAGFFDIQSVTGKYGKEVKEIVRQQGEFAQIMQADFNNWIAGTGKAMANYGFGAKELTDFNKSAFATVKVGETTFDKLANVMSVYAGSAAASKQTYDTANKLFALFTVRTKSVDEAATLTKSLFNDLTKESTLAALKSVKINPFDDNKKLKQADTILLELNKKFRDLKGDKSIINLKNQFTGSEGLIAYIQAATDQSDNLYNTLKSFNDTKFEFADALKLAKGDANYLNNILQNKLHTSIIKIGEAMLPIKVMLLENIIPALEKFNFWYLNSENGRRGQFNTQGQNEINDQYSDLVNNLSNMSYNDMLEAQKQIIGDLNAFKAQYDNFIAPQEKILNKIDKINCINDNRTIDEKLSQATGYYSDVLAGRKERLEYLSKNLLTLWKQAQGKSHATNGNGGNTDNDTGNDTSSEGITAITGSAKQVRNITVNIDAFNKGGINTQQTNLQHMDSRQIEDWFTEMCLRVVRNLETSY